MSSQVILATAGYDHTIKLWEATSGICYRTLQYADSQVSLTFSGCMHASYISIRRTPAWEEETRAQETATLHYCCQWACRSINLRSPQTSACLLLLATLRSACLR